MMFELVFEVTQEADGRFVAECLSESIVTEADDWAKFRINVREAVAGFSLRAQRVERQVILDSLT